MSDDIVPEATQMDETVTDKVWRILEIGIMHIKCQRGYPKVDDFTITDMEKRKAAEHIVEVYNPYILMDE